MIKNKFGELVYDQESLVDLLMQGINLSDHVFVTDKSVKIYQDQLDTHLKLQEPTDSTLTLQEFDAKNQSNWYMPDEYKNMDIAEYILGLCYTEQELQRVGKELLMYQNKNLFDLLRYLKYLMDTIQSQGIIHGVGRGSSVASYVLYLLGVHKIDSIYYDLDPEEFLR